MGHRRTIHQVIPLVELDDRDGAVALDQSARFTKECNRVINLVQDHCNEHDVGCFIGEVDAGFGRKED